MRYGMPYKGSKNGIAERIIKSLPKAENFYDLFGGGGAITHCALLSGKYKQVHYNELDSVVCDGFEMSINGEFKNENRWISRDDFEKLKGIDPYVAICFSFGNDLKTYCYSKDKERFKRAVHNFLFFNDKTELSEYLPLDKLEFTSNNVQNKRIEFQRYLKNYRKEVEKFYDVDTMCVLQSLNNLDRLQSLESLERLESLDSPNSSIKITNLNYSDVYIKTYDAVIYCDPPYKNKNKYKQEFDFDEFYNWARFQENIFISEYEMPDDFIEITSFDKRVLMDATAKAGYKKEKLFTNKITFDKIKDNLI